MKAGTGFNLALILFLIVFVAAAIFMISRDMERVGYCEALEAEYVKGMCIRGDEVVHRF